MEKIVLGILAHVDAGKTTLSESLLYLSGKIDKLGRVDNKDAYLDTFELEKARGITIFSKQAVFETGNTQITLLDTPGHVDFSAEMERTLQVLDYAILVINGADGVQSHTETLWKLLEIYEIPVFLFINKMDHIASDKKQLLKEITQKLGDKCIDFGQADMEAFFEQLSMCDEAIMESYLEAGNVKTEQIQAAIKNQRVFPCFFGSALKLEGVKELLQGIEKYTIPPCYGSEFGAKIFKISRDEQGNRLTHMKLTGGVLKVRDTLKGDGWEEKINQIRIYSGNKFEAVAQAEPGCVCAVTGLTKARSGEGLGSQKHSTLPILEPVLSYQVIPDGMDLRLLLPKLREIEDEEPELRIEWNEQLQEIHAQVMGEVQIEVLQSMIKERFGVEVTFGEGKTVYKETIANTVEGVGHFEPLRHYAEVHLLLEPAQPGSGLQFGTICSEDILGKSWQRLVLSHLKEKNHKGVLTGSAITDMKITLVSGKAHNKHTDGGDFREATYRAVRQGLKEAQSVLLEPYYSFTIELPEKMVGRAMTDIERMYGRCEITKSSDGIAVLEGSAPVATIRNYQAELASYTKGQGKLFCTFMGYDLCHNEDEVIENMGYDSERDVENPTGSVFCAGGESFLVSWDEVKNYMHLESYLKQREALSDNPVQKTKAFEEKYITPDEVEKIFNQTFFANKGKHSTWHRPKTAKDYYDFKKYVQKPHEPKEKYLLVDGYNIIHAWQELKELAKDNIEGARMKLIDILSNYQGVKKYHVIVVFDAYRVERSVEDIISYGNLHVVYTKEAQTADQYIERFSYDNRKKYDITVATSDGAQQMIIRGAGCALLSARELKLEVEKVNELIDHQSKQQNQKDISISASLSSKTKSQIEGLVKKLDK